MAQEAINTESEMSKDAVSDVVGVYYFVIRAANEHGLRAAVMSGINDLILTCSKADAHGLLREAEGEAVCEIFRQIEDVWGSGVVLERFEDAVKYRREEVDNVQRFRRQYDIWKDKHECE